MNLNRYDTLFEDYLTKIVLTKAQAGNIDSKVAETLSLFLANYENDLEMYSQGSYAMGTTVRPLSAAQSPTSQAGEYDVDIVLERSSWQGAKNALESVNRILSEEYGDKLDSKQRESCERVEHSTDTETEVGFHVDYVPIKNTDKRRVARRSQDMWSPSDTKQLVEWFSDFSSDYTFLPAIILMLKRMRDNAGLTDVLSSICITALVCTFYEDKGSYAEDLLNILDDAIARFDIPHSKLSITIEPLEDDLADRISASDQQSILSFLRECRRKLENGFTTCNLSVLRSVLSTSFPADIDDFPEDLEALRNRDWGIETDGSLRYVNISEKSENGSFITKVRKRFSITGQHLVFHVNAYDKTEYGIRWQVLNANGSPKRRGNLFNAKGPSGKENSSSNDFVNHETESYIGEHWIKYYIYSKLTHRVVEIGHKFYVEVE